MQEMGSGMSIDLNIDLTKYEQGLRHLKSSLADSGREGKIDEILINKRMR